MSDPKVVLRSEIDGEFEGFDGETLFKLSNGTYWLQDEYKYWYYYAYCPPIEILKADGRTYLRVVGCSDKVAVRDISSGVIESRIDGEFTGWDGESTYRLVNGQVWKQSHYKYKYKYKFMPHVVIYKAGGGHVMQVAGTHAKVQRIE
jgi:hypothetical protein